MSLTTDLDAAYVDCGEAWALADGTAFTGIFRLLRSEEGQMPGLQRQVKRGELRWRTSELATAPALDELFVRSAGGGTWQMVGEPEDDGFGEMIAQVRRVARPRLGVQ